MSDYVAEVRSERAAFGDGPPGSALVESKYAAADGRARYVAKIRAAVYFGMIEPRQPKLVTVEAPF
jgi:hypothetical protein